MNKNILVVLCVLTNLGVTYCADDDEKTGSSWELISKGANAACTTVVDATWKSYRYTTKKARPGLWLEKTISDADQETPVTETGDFLQRNRRGYTETGDDHHLTNFINTGNNAAENALAAFRSAANTLIDLHNLPDHPADRALLEAGESWQKLSELAALLQAMPLERLCGLPTPPPPASGDDES